MGAVPGGSILFRSNPGGLMKTFRNLEAVHAPLVSNAHRIEIRGPERALILSGQVGVRRDGCVPEDPIEQLQVPMANVISNLEAANMQVTDPLKLTFHLTGEMEPAARREALGSILGSYAPSSTLVFVAVLANLACKVEIDASASRQD